MTEPAASPRRFAIEAILFLSYAVFSVTWMAISPLAKELMAYFDVTKAEFALLNTVVTASKVVAPLVAGAIAVRIGVRNAILIGSAFVGFAIVGPLFPSFPVFLASRAVYGIGGAVLVSLVPAMIMQWFPKNELAVVNGINGVAANTGFALAISLTMSLSQVPSLGWKNTLVLYSLVSTALFAAWALVGREAQAAKPATGAAPAPKRVGYRDVWKMKETWLIALSFTGPVALYLTFSLWLPTFYREQLGFDPATASRYCSIVLYAGIPTAIVGGILAQVVGVRRPFLMIGGALAGTAAFGTFLAHSPALIVVSNVALGIGLFLPTASLTTLLMELEGVTPRHVALISSTMVSFCYLVNSFVPNLVGWVSDKTGSFVPGFAVLSAFVWVVVLGGVLLPETGPKAAKGLAVRAAAQPT